MGDIASLPISATWQLSQYNKRTFKPLTSSKVFANVFYTRRKLLTPNGINAIFKQLIIILIFDVHQFAN